MRTLIILSVLVALTTAGSVRLYNKNKRGLLYGSGPAAYGYGAPTTVVEGADASNTLPPAVEPITASGLQLSSEPADTSNAIVEVPAPDLSATVTASYQATEGEDYGSGGRGAGSAGDYGGNSKGFGASDTNYKGGITEAVFSTSSNSVASAGDYVGNDITSVSTAGTENEGRQIGAPYLISIHRELVRRFGVPVAKPYPVPVARNVYIKIERAVPYQVDRPYAVRVAVPQPVAVDRPYPVPVDRPYSVPVPSPVPVPVPRPVAVPVPHPVPVPVPRTIVSQPAIAAAPVLAAHRYGLAGPGFPFAGSAAAFGIGPSAIGLAAGHPAIGFAAAPSAIGVSPVAVGVSPAAIGVIGAQQIGVAAAPSAIGVAPSAIGVNVAHPAVGVAAVGVATPAAFGVHASHGAVIHHH